MKAALFLQGGNKLTERQINSRRVFFRFPAMEIIVPFPPLRQIVKILRSIVAGSGSG